MYEFDPEAKIYHENDELDRIAMVIVIEYCPWGEMFDFILSTGAFDTRMTRFYLKQLIEAIHAIHSVEASHRDIKFENILLDEHFNLKVTDFGFATFNPICSTYKGTKGYMAPEIHLGRNYNGQKVDIFAAGVLAYIMLSGRPPFGTSKGGDHYYDLFRRN